MRNEARQARGAQGASFQSWRIRRERAGRFRSFPYIGSDRRGISERLEALERLWLLPWAAQPARDEGAACRRSRQAGTKPLWSRLSCFLFFLLRGVGRRRANGACPRSGWAGTKNAERRRDDQREERRQRLSSVSETPRSVERSETEAKPSCFGRRAAKRRTPNRG